MLMGMGKIHYYNTNNTDLWEGALLQVSYIVKEADFKALQL